MQLQRFLSLGFLQKSTFLAIGRQGRVCGSQRPEHSVGSQQGWGHLRSHQHQVPQVRGPQLLPVPSPAGDSRLAPWHLLPQARPQSSAGEAWPFPAPAHPSPSKQLGWEHVSGPRLCPQCSAHHSRPGRAGAEKPPLAAPHLLAASAAPTRGHVGAGGAEEVCLGATRSRWQPAGESICGGRERPATTGHRASLLLSQPARPTTPVSPGQEADGQGEQKGSHSLRLTPQYFPGGELE